MIRQIKVPPIFLLIQYLWVNFSVTLTILQRPSPTHIHTHAHTFTFMDSLICQAVVEEVAWLDVSVDDLVRSELSSEPSVELSCTPSLQTHSSLAGNPVRYGLELRQGNGELKHHLEAHHL